MKFHLGNKAKVTLNKAKKTGNKKQQKPDHRVVAWLKNHAQEAQEKRSFTYIVLSMAYRFFDHTVLARGAELSYYFLFSMPPLVMFGSAMLGLLNLNASLFSGLSQVIPTTVTDTIGSIYQVLQRGNSSILMMTGLFLSIYFSSAAIRSLMRGLDTAYHVHKGRNPILHVIMSFFFAVIFLSAIVATLLVLVAGGGIIEFILQLFPQLEHVRLLVQILRYAVMILPLLGIFILLYTFTPNRKLKLRSSIPGAVFSVLVWVGLSIGFSFYATHFNRYANLYGSIGILMVLMLWLHLSGAVFLMGGELNAILLDRKEYLRQQSMLDEGDDDTPAEAENTDE